MPKFHRPWTWKAADIIKDTISDAKLLGLYGLGQAYYKRKKIAKGIQHSLPVMAAMNKKLFTPPNSGKVKKRSYSPKPGTSKKKSKAKRKLNFSKTDMIVYRGKKRGPHYGESSMMSKFKRKKGKDTFLPYHLHGWVDTREINGTVEDPNCLYLGYSAQCNLDTLNCVVRALLRRLIRKCFGMDIVNVEQKVLNFSTQDQKYIIRLMQKNDDTNDVTQLRFHQISVNDTILTIANSFLDDFRKYANGFTFRAVNYLENLFKFTIVSQTDGLGFSLLLGELNFEELKVHVKTKAAIKMQNRSRSTEGSTSMDSVSNNPIIGRVYETRGLPMTRDDFGRFSLVTTVGVNNVRAADYSNAEFNHLKEPVAPGYFTNLVKSNKIRIMPGEIKYANIEFKTDEYLLTFMKRLRWDEGNDTRFHYNRGTHLLFGLEDVINVNADENIIISYEVNRETGAFVTEHHKAYSTGVFNAVTQNAI
nr:MAG: putative capsid protein [Arizlama virus]